MALESATYINQLVATNPTLADPKGQGDDHLRMIKSVLQNTFPNFTGATTVTQAQLNVLADPASTFQSGMIIVWAGPIAGIPTGWLLCNGVGTVTSGALVPDLRNRFVIGAGSTYAPGNFGGSVSHDHVLTINGTSLTEAQLPTHTHGMYGSFVQGLSGGGSSISVVNPVPGTALTTPVGGGQAHTHTGAANATSSLPPYFALAYIIKN